MASADDRKEPMQRQLFDRMDGEAQRKRSEAFRQATQGRGKPMTYGTGVPPEPKKKGAKK